VGWRRPWTYIIKKVFEITPPVTKSDAATSILRKPGGGRISGALNHSFPYIILRPSGHPVPIKLLPRYITLPTPTRAGAAAAEGLLHAHKNRPAVITMTLAKPAALQRNRAWTGLAQYLNITVKLTRICFRIIGSVNHKISQKRKMHKAKAKCLSLVLLTDHQ
jgi:hypothetical protein